MSSLLTSLLAVLLKMIYIFVWETHFKLGSCHAPFERLDRGFWHDVHPNELCGKLDDCRLTHLFNGDLKFEQILHELLIPDCGEFYRLSRLEETLHFLQLCLDAADLPESRPPGPPGRRVRPKTIMRPCCGGQHGAFQRDDHMRRSFVTKGKKAPCERCGKMLSVRRDKVKQHKEMCV